MLRLKFFTKLKMSTKSAPDPQKYFKVGNLKDFGLETGAEFNCTPKEIPGTRKRVNLVNHRNKLFAILNVCPHQGAPLHKGKVVDIEDMGIRFGSAITCTLHGWTFGLDNGVCGSNPTVVDVFDVIEFEDQVFVSFEPKNKNVPGKRRDFGGQELVYNPELGWI